MLKIHSSRPLTHETGFRRRFQPLGLTGRRRGRDILEILYTAGAAKFPKGVTGYDLIKWCKSRLTFYKIPEYIEFRDMLPKSKVGKYLRRELRKEEQKRETL